MLNPLFRFDTGGKSRVPVLMGWNKLGAAVHRHCPTCPFLVVAQSLLVQHVPF